MNNCGYSVSEAISID